MSSNPSREEADQPILPGAVCMRANLPIVPP